MSTSAVSVISARGRFRLLDLREIWTYRELLWMLTLRDIKVRYKDTTLGVLWALLRQAMSVVIFSVIFGRLAKVPSDGIAYPVFVFAGLLPWMYFAQAVSSASASVLSASSLITRVYFPRLIIPLATNGVALVDFQVSLVFMPPLMYWFGTTPDISVLAVPMLIGAAFLTSLGVGIWLAAVTVMYRDVRHIEPFVIQMWMFATPVVYPASLIPDSWRWLVNLNPMTGVVEGFRSAWLGLPFNWTSLGTCALVSAVVLITGVLYFERVEREFADLI